MAKGHVTPHNMLARTQWVQPGLLPSDMSNMNVSGLRRGTRGVERQSPHGQKLLDRGAQRVNTRSCAPAFPGRVPVTSAEASALLKTGISYFDCKTTVPFVARFGGASESFLDLSLKGLQLSPKTQEKLKKIAALIPPALWGAANLATLNAYDKALNEVESLWLFDVPLPMHLMPMLNFIVPATALLPTVFKQERSSNRQILGLLAGSAAVALGLSKGWPIVSEIALSYQGFVATWVVYLMSQVILGVGVGKKDEPCKGY